MYRYSTSKGLYGAVGDRAHCNLLATCASAVSRRSRFRRNVLEFLLMASLLPLSKNRIARRKLRERFLGKMRPVDNRVCRLCRYEVRFLYPWLCVTDLCRHSRPPARGPPPWGKRTRPLLRSPGLAIKV